MLCDLHLYGVVVEAGVVAGPGAGLPRPRPVLLVAPAHPRHVPPALPAQWSHVRAHFRAHIRAII